MTHHAFTWPECLATNVCLAARWIGPGMLGERIVN